MAEMRGDRRSMRSIRGWGLVFGQNQILTMLAATDFQSEALIPPPPKKGGANPPTLLPPHLGIVLALAFGFSQIPDTPSDLESIWLYIWVWI